MTSPLSFAYWVPNVSGGLVVSKIEQRTDWGYDYNKRLAQTAERVGFEYALTQVRYMASYGAENQHESTAFSLALLLATERLKVITAIHPGLWHPAVLAKWIATADHLSGGRTAINVVSGWFKGEFTALGEPWLEHDERYRRSEEFIAAVREIWTQESATYAGDFYRIKDFSLKPKPLQDPHPTIFQGGNSHAAQEMAGRESDVYFMNGGSPEKIGGQIDRVADLAADAGRAGEVGFALNGFALVRDTEEEARRVLADIIDQADHEAVEGFGASVTQAGRSTADGSGMWQDSTFEDLVQYNDGFRTGLIGTPEQVAERIMTYKRLGVTTLLLGFLHFQEELEYFGERVIPLVRELEAAEAAAEVSA
ncbi:putative alkanesulfonate monooxygenase [Marmoricola endophyticus]|uniref:Alkanesulfonate monooxygenase n=1 Tax=Marmoricola endophyticus TaxID=2040280 RepID=A0A917BKP9_9ACTN|nr:dimethyl sulfone monooxygenase SfnG [Marmoricola endophyticus]GGF45878.1 putative alkanesulfonate monooxygenase [Marmoricola endophyticus]